MKLWGLVSRVLLAFPGDSQHLRGVAQSGAVQKNFSIFGQSVKITVKT